MPDTKRTQSLSYIVMALEMFLFRIGARRPVMLFNGTVPPLYKQQARILMANKELRDDLINLLQSIEG